MTESLILNENGNCSKPTLVEQRKPSFTKKKKKKKIIKNKKKAELKLCYFSAAVTYISDPQLHY
jgi:hypothetical protein